MSQDSYPPSGNPWGVAPSGSTPPDPTRPSPADPYASGSSSEPPYPPGQYSPGQYSTDPYSTDPYSSDPYPTAPYSAAGAPVPPPTVRYENYSAPVGPSIGSQPPAPLQPPAYYPMPIAAPGLPYTQAGGLYGFDPVTGLPYSSKSKVTAGILGIFLGGFGVGRFYTGHIGIAIAQLLLTIFGLGIGAIWGFIDGIVMLAGSPRDSDGRPLR